MTNAQHLGHTSVVIGGSIAGLLAASVLADHYDEVVVLDRDRFGRFGEYRKGVQQARHAHGLLAGGSRAMEALLPGLTGELVERGAIEGDLQGSCTWVNEGCVLSRAATGLTALLTDRLLLEDQVRTRVRALPNVVVHERCDTLGLHVDERRRVDGVRVAWRDRDDAEQLIAADLVVDASGRGSRAPVWLQAIGFDGPAVDEIVVNLTYTTRDFVRDGADADAHSLIVSATAAHPRGGVMLAQPDGRWVVTLGGYLGDTAPGDLDGFHDFAAGMPSPVIADALPGLTPLGEPRTFKYRASSWRRYDRLRRFPDGFLVLGDAICSFNPIFGQGMTVAAREALALRDTLRRHGTARLARRFFRAAKHEIEAPWKIAAGADLRLAGVRGRRTLETQLVNRYLLRYFRAAQHDEALGYAFLRVLNLLAPPTTLLSPRRMARVVANGRSPQPATRPKASPVPVSSRG
jgi:2-polyprenyl-6-methoxyphenol hydroxylase-like FAD-dependent oxidoreductase